MSKQNTSGEAFLSHNYEGLPLLRGLFTNRRSCTLSCYEEPQNGEPIFVVVHGTWNSRAGWTRRDSQLFMELAKHWPRGGFYRFNWSGANGARHRLVASDVLTEELNHLAARYPSSKVVTISHSHGGNVVAWACTRLSRTLPVAVYLNTPFIQVLDKPGTFNLILRIVLYFGGTVLLYPLVNTVPELLFPPHSDARSVASGITIIVMIIWIVFLQAFVPPRLQAVRDRLAQVSNSNRKISRELVAFVVGDEANSAFGAVYFGQWVGRRITVMLLLAVVPCAALGTARVIANGTADRMGQFLLGCSGAVVFAYLLLAASAYGIVQGLVALDSSTVVTPAPVGKTDFVTVAWTRRDRLRHSLIYESPEAIAVIVRWLESALSAEYRQ